MFRVDGTRMLKFWESERGVTGVQFLKEEDAKKKKKKKKKVEKRM